MNVLSRIFAVLVLSLALAGCVTMTPVAPPGPRDDLQMSANEAVAFLGSYKGLVCDISSDLMRYCHGFDDVNEVTAITLSKDTKNLILIGKNGWQKSFALGSLQMSLSNPDVLSGKGYTIILDNDWELTAASAEQAKRLTDAIGRLRLLPRDMAAARWVRDAVFVIIARAYRSLPVKPVPGEDVRRLVVQADDAVKREQFTDAARLYGQIVAIAPWWPAGHYNAASILAETGQFHDAITEMQDYLALVPDAPNARQMQDKIYVWQRQDKTVAAAFDPAMFVSPPEPGKPRLGVIPTNVPPIVAAARHLPNSDGALILYVARGGAADAAGLAPEDIVAAYDAQPVKTAADLAAAVRRTSPQPGTEVPVEIIRGDRRQRVTVRF